MTVNLKCQALDQDGKQCKYAGTRVVKYHGENELYSSFHSEKYPITWVKIKVCKHHYEENFQK